MKSIIIFSGIFSVVCGIKGYGMNGITGLISGLFLGFFLPFGALEGLEAGERKYGREFSEVQFWYDLVVFSVCAAILFSP
jgi:hypothetical protein